MPSCRVLQQIAVYFPNLLFFLLFCLQCQDSKPDVAAIQYSDMSSESQLPYEDSYFLGRQKKLFFPGIEYAYHPSIINYGDGYLVAFRWDHHFADVGGPQTSYMGLIKLDRDLNPISKVSFIDFRNKTPWIPSVTEDPRLIEHAGKIYILFNDAIDAAKLTFKQMFLAEINEKADGVFEPGPANLLADCDAKLGKNKTKIIDGVQKNWAPFSDGTDLYFIYSFTPFEILKYDFKTKKLTQAETEESDLKHIWAQFGRPRGGTQAQRLANGELLTFFHSSVIRYGVHYYMASACTMTGEPPFKLLRCLDKPILKKDLYKKSLNHKTVFFPAGFAFVPSEPIKKESFAGSPKDFDIKNSTLELSFGLHDREAHSIQINLNRLLEEMIPVS